MTKFPVSTRFKSFTYVYTVYLYIYIVMLWCNPERLVFTWVYHQFPIATFDYKQPVIAKAGWGQSHQQGKETAQRPKPGPLSHPELVVFAMETNLVGGFIIYIYHYILVGGIPTL